MRNHLAMAREEICLAKLAVQLLQPAKRDGGKDVVLEVILHPCPDEVIFEPPGVAGARDPVHALRVAQTGVKVFGNRLQTEDHRVHAHDRDEPEDNVEKYPPPGSLKEDELTEDDELRDELTDEQLGPGQQAGGCARFSRRALNPTGGSPECRDPEQILEKPASPSILNPEVTKEFSDLVLRMLAKKTKNRHKDMQEVLVEFRNIKPFKEDALEFARRIKHEETERYKTTLDKAGRLDSRADHLQQQLIKQDPDFARKNA